MCFKKYKIENVQISPEMKRDPCSAMVRNNQRLKVGCFSGSVLCLLSFTFITCSWFHQHTTTFISSYNYPHFENEGNDVQSGQDPPKIPWAGSRCSQISIQSTPNSRWGEMSLAVGTELCWKQWKAERGVAGGQGELPLFILVEVMDIWPLEQDITLELALAGNSRNIGL